MITEYQGRMVGHANVTGEKKKREESSQGDSDIIPKIKCHDIGEEAAQNLWLLCQRQEIELLLDAEEETGGSVIGCKYYQTTLRSRAHGSMMGLQFSSGESVCWENLSFNRGCSLEYRSQSSISQEIPRLKLFRESFLFWGELPTKLRELQEKLRELQEKKHELLAKGHSRGRRVKYWDRTHI